MLSQEARKLHFSALVVDCHLDSFDRVLDRGEDLSQDTSGDHVDVLSMPAGGLNPGIGHWDLPRMRAGGLKAQFFAGCVYPEQVLQHRTIQRVLDTVDAVKGLCARHPQDLELARTARDVRRIAAEGKCAALLCVEGGHAIVDDLSVLRQFFELGVRYMTLTWNISNNWADSSTETSRHHGLTDFGREVVGEMNRLGMMVDISHVSEETFWAALETSSRPVIASHSSARALCDHPRNLTDEQIRAVGEKGGVVCVTFVPAFISQAYREATQALRERKQWEHRYLEAEHTGQPQALEQATKALEARYQELAISELSLPTVSDIVDHAEHIIRVAGVDHVGLGSDFDGTGSLPAGMEDCSKLPAITEELLRRGHSEDDIRKLLGENVLRVMEEVIGQ